MTGLPTVYGFMGLKLPWKLQLLVHDTCGIHLDIEP